MVGKVGSRQKHVCLRASLATTRDDEVVMAESLITPIKSANV